MNMQMKFKNIAVGLLVLGWLVSCSGDDTHTPTPPEGQKATLSILSHVRSNETQVKAEGGDPNALPGETRVHDLTAYVFSEDGTQLYGYKRNEAPDENLEVSEIEINSTDTKIACVVIANLPAALAGEVADYHELNDRLSLLSSQTQTHLTFSTELMTPQEILEAGESYYIGFSDKTNLDHRDTPALLTRIAARVEVNTIETRFAGTSLQGNTVRIDHITLANVKSESHLFSPGDWGAVEVASSHLVYGAGALEAASRFAAESTPVDYIGGSPDDLTVNDERPILTPALQMYAFENTSTQTPTLLVVKATLLETGESRIFTAVINVDGRINRYDHDLIKRNYIYRLHISFGKNSFDPAVPSDDASMDIRVEVAGWGYVHQEEEI